MTSYPTTSYPSQISARPEYKHVTLLLSSNQKYLFVYIQKAPYSTINSQQSLYNKASPSTISLMPLKAAQPVLQATLAKLACPACGYLLSRAIVQAW